VGADGSNLNFGNNIEPQFPADGKSQTFVSNSISVIYIGRRSGGQALKLPPATILFR